MRVGVGSLHAGAAAASRPDECERAVRAGLGAGRRCVGRGSPRSAIGAAARLPAQARAGSRSPEPTTEEYGGMLAPKRASRSSIPAHPAHGCGTTAVKRRRREPAADQRTNGRCLYSAAGARYDARVSCAARWAGSRWVAAVRAAWAADNRGGRLGVVQRIAKLSLLLSAPTCRCSACDARVRDGTAPLVMPVAIAQPSALRVFECGGLRHADSRKVDRPRELKQCAARSRGESAVKAGPGDS